METRLIQQVDGVKITLSVPEALKFLESPVHVQGEVASMLRGGVVLTEDGAKAKKSHHTRTGRPHRPFPKIECEECHKLFATNVLERHQRTKHGITSKP